MNKLFVYGIFLGKGMRDEFGMSNSRYATVRDYVTVAKSSGGHIVEAIPFEGAVLTGLIVEVAPYMMGHGAMVDTWEELDRLEGGYDRVEIVTTSNERAYMYVGKV